MTRQSSDGLAQSDNVRHERNKEAPHKPRHSSDMVERRDLAWGRNALAFIRERGLETEFSDWCGRWPMPEKECAPNVLLNELVGRAAHQRATSGDSSFADIGHAALEASHHAELVEALRALLNEARERGGAVTNGEAMLYLTYPTPVSTEGEQEKNSGFGSLTKALPQRR